MPSYDPNNIFAKIVRGELPAYKVYEDDRCVAFLDIMPRTIGHTLVIPKSQVRNILDVAPDDLAHVMQIAQRIAKAGIKAFGANGVTIQQFNEPAGGQVVFHLHVHVIPRHDGVAMKPPASEKEKPEALAEHAVRPPEASVHVPIGERVVPDYVGAELRVEERGPGPDRGASDGR